MFEQDANLLAIQLDLNVDNFLLLLRFSCSMKETFDIVEEEVTVGSIRRKPSFSQEDAVMVSRLREAYILEVCLMLL
ncbi:hypothetical protein OAD00_02440 [Saprospiraceae bacterium]|nr:hypothetical protein [Saprospiraceae bacterium]